MIERTTLKSLTLIFTTCVLAYLLFWSGKHYSIDGIVMFEYAKSLLFQGSSHIDPPIYWANQEIRTSVWSLGQTLVYMPILLALASIFLGNVIYRQIPYDPHNPYYPMLMGEHSLPLCIVDPTHYHGAGCRTGVCPGPAAGSL
jgi:hypothetical protein